MKIYKKQVLNNIELDVIVQGLQETSNMIYLAYLSVDEFKDLQGQCVGIHHNFGRLCGESRDALQQFSLNSNKVQQNLYRAMYALFNDPNVKWERALKAIESCSTVAQNLSTDAIKLSISFRGLSDETVKTQQSILKQHNITNEDRVQTEKQMTEQLAEQENLSIITLNLKKQEKEIDDLHKQISQEASTAENRAFATALVSAILRPISEGLGTVAKIYAQSTPAGMVSSVTSTIASTTTDIVNKPSNDTPTTTPSKTVSEKPPVRSTDKEEENKSVSSKSSKDIKQSLENLEKKKTVSENRLKTLKTEQEEQNKKIEELKQKSEKISDKEKEELKKLEEELLKKKDSITIEEKELTSISSEYNTLKKEYDSSKEAEGAGTKAAIAQGVSQAASKAADQLEKMSDTLQETATQLREKQSQLFQMLIDKQNEEAKALGRQKELTLRLERAVDVKDNLALASAGLTLAKDAMSRVTVTLETVAHFWNQMGIFCGHLGNSAVSSDMKDFYTDYLEDKKSNPNLTFAGLLPDFVKEDIISNFAQWKAIEEVSMEFSKKSSEVHQNVLKDFGASLHGEERITRMKQLSDKHFKSLVNEIDLKTKAKMENEKKKALALENKLMTV